MKKVLDVGQCNADHSSISNLLSRHFKVELHRSHSHDDVVAILADHSFDLILINRLLDADGSPGMNVLQTLKSNESSAGTPVMVVSNYEDAQSAAIEAGAVQGFGKSKLTSPETIELLGQFLN